LLRFSRVFQRNNLKTSAHNMHTHHWQLVQRVLDPGDFQRFNNPPREKNNKNKNHLTVMTTLLSIWIIISCLHSSLSSLN
jgi:hypothetical protein